MNVFRGQSGTLKLMTLSWRKSLTSTVNPAEITRMSAWSPVTFCQYSSSAAKPESDVDHQNLERKRSEDIDPFGLGEAVKTGNSVLVQGFYKESEEQNPTAEPSKPPPPPKASAPKPKPAPPKASQPSSEDNDPDRRSRLSLYDSWLKQRASLDQQSELGETDTYREAHFGQVRVDSDNPAPAPSRRPRHDGHVYREEKLHVPEMPTRPRRPRPAKQDPDDNEPITETIEADHSVRMRASDFLQRIRGRQTESEETADNPRESIVIERIIKPASAPENNLEDIVSAREAAEHLDLKVIPKQYLLPDFNAITQEDMWNVLKKSIVFQNDFLLAINKPSGIPVHSKARDCRHTVIQFLKKFADLAKVEEVFPVHRIDKETTGVLLLAKDKKVASIIKEKFANRQIHKVYLGVSKLCPEIREGTIKIPIGEGLIPGTKNKYRQVLRPDLREYGIKATTRTCVEAITNYKVLHSIREASFLEIEPVTGYKHQIRVHLGMGLGCPIFGDHKYSHREKLAPQRLHPHVLHKIKLRQSKVREMPLHLHCNKVSFTLPKEFTESTEPIYIHASIPYFMKYTLKRLGLIR